MSVRRSDFDKIIIKACKWYKSHAVGRAMLSQEQLSYLAGLTGKDRENMLKFPIYCMVKQNQKLFLDLDIPVCGKLAIVCGYKQGYLILKESPDDENRHVVHPSKVVHVANWRGMTPKRIERDVEWFICKQKKGGQKCLV
ncbi:MAG: hypothetical protein AB7H97_06385 [Pseudobdellovibrionaceae bacterium]